MRDALFVLTLGGFAAFEFVVWLVGFLGYGQWPDPRGRYYKRWLRSNDGTHYYEWLAVQKRWRDPWAMWAVRDAARDKIKALRAGSRGSLKGTEQCGP